MLNHHSILPAIAPPITSVNSPFNPTMKARMFPLMNISKHLPAAESHDGKEIWP